MKRRISNGCSSEVFDGSLGYDIHRNDRPDNPHGGVLIAAKKDFELYGAKWNKVVELISETITVSKQKTRNVEIPRKPGFPKDA